MLTVFLRPRVKHGDKPVPALDAGSQRNRRYRQSPKAPSTSLLPSASADGLKDLEQSLFLCGLQPLSSIVFKGVKPHIGTGKAGIIIYPSAEADGKRELAARGLPHLMRKETGGIGNPQRAVRLYFRPKLVSVKRRDRSERPERLLFERSEFQTRQRTKGTK